MNSQLLALDTILPSLLAFGGLVFLALAFVPWIARLTGVSVVATVVLAAVGVACVAVGVLLWAQLLTTQLAAFANQPAARPNAAPAPSALPSASTPASATASASRSRAVATASASLTPSLAPTATLAPVAAVAFQPDTAPAHDVTVAIEPFEHGAMLYRSDTKQLYVLAENKTFKVYPDTWDESQPDSGDLTPAAGKFEPRRGFGKLWRSNPEVRRLLGWALSPEAGLTAQIGGDGNSSTVRANLTYLFHKDGTYSTQ
ncbi:MAG: hypothetical protein KGJ86_06455 [Chloroflexota bacterium]|nr:hypothetical protein [Chloroflexota bacterium]